MATIKNHTRNCQLSLLHCHIATLHCNITKLLTI